MAGLGLSGSVWAQEKPDVAEAAMAKSVDASTAADVAMLEKIVDINSGTMNLVEAW